MGRCAIPWCQKDLGDGERHLGHERMLSDPTFAYVAVREKDPRNPDGSWKTVSSPTPDSLDVLKVRKDRLEEFLAPPSAPKKTTKSKARS